MVEGLSTCEVEFGPAHAEFAARAASRLSATHPHFAVEMRRGRLTMTGRAVGEAEMRVAWKSALLTELEFARSEAEREELLRALFA